MQKIIKLRKIYVDKCAFKKCTSISFHSLWSGSVCSLSVSMNVRSLFVIELISVSSFFVGRQTATFAFPNEQIVVPLNHRFAATLFSSSSAGNPSRIFHPSSTSTQNTTIIPFPNSFTYYFRVLYRVVYRIRFHRSDKTNNTHTHTSTTEYFMKTTN